MNKLLKIIMPSIVAMAIITIIFVTMSDKEVTDEALKSVPPFDFVEYMEKRVDSEINDGDIKKFELLYKEIDTEEHLVNILTNEPVLESSDAAQCYEYLFDSYFEEFKKKADDCFASSNWSNCNTIRSESRNLQKRKGRDQAQDKELANFISYVNRFYEVCQLVRDCKTRANYQEIEEKDFLTKTPYSNNKKMRSALADAKSNWERNLLQEYNNFKYNSAKWDCETFDLNKDDLYEKIQDFGLEFSSNNDFENGLTSKLLESLDGLRNLSCVTQIAR